MNYEEHAIALVLGGHVQGLGIARNLGKKGIPVYIVDDTGACIARFSKYCQRFFRLSTIKEDSVLRDFLIKLATSEKLEGGVLYPTHDSAVATLARHKDELSRYFKIATPAWSITQIAYDKRLTYELALECRVPVPQTFFPENIEDAKAAAKDLGYPILLKPAIMHKFYSGLKVKVIEVVNEDQLVQAYNRACQVIPASEIMVQELIPGPPHFIHSFCSFFKDGEVKAHFSNRHLRRIPMDFGKVATMVEFIQNSFLEEASQKLLSRLGYYGISEVEFKLDPRDNTLKLLEINPRSWKQMTLGNLAGVDLAFLLYQDLTRQEFPRAKSGISQEGVWVDLIPDFVVSIQEIVRGNMRLREYLRSLKGPIEYAVWSNDDPLPFFMLSLLLPVLWYLR